MNSSNATSDSMSDSDAGSVSAEVADKYLGNVNEDRDLQSQVALDQKHSRCLEVFIDRIDARKGRILAQTQAGQPVGLVKSREWILRDGDVMMTQRQQRVLIRLKQQQVIALQFDRKAYNSPVKLMSLGHAMGNQHWAVIRIGETLYVEITADADRKEATLREIVETLEIKGLHIVRELKDANHFINFSTASLTGFSSSSSSPHSHSHAH